MMNLNDKSTRLLTRRDCEVTGNQVLLVRSTIGLSLLCEQTIQNYNSFKDTNLTRVDQMHSTSNDR